MQLLASVLSLLDLPTVFGGHTYDIGSSSSRESSGGGDGGGGIGTASIVAVLAVILVAVGALASLDPSSARRKLRAAAPAALMGVVIVMPLVLWASSSGGVEQGLIVERATDLPGGPELLVNLVDKDLNKLHTTRGRRAVRVECLGRGGQVVIDARQRWPFINEPGYDYPHVHQRATREQLVQAERCRLRGTSVRLEADVEGALIR
jgi:hypothetical protein